MSDSLDTRVEGCTCDGEGTTLAATHHEDVVLLSLLARGDEVDAANYIHIGTSIIIGVLVAEVVAKPVAIIILIITTIVDYLSAN